MTWRDLTCRSSNLPLWIVDDRTEFSSLDEEQSVASRLHLVHRGFGILRAFWYFRFKALCCGGQWLVCFVRLGDCGCGIGIFTLVVLEGLIRIETDHQIATCEWTRTDRSNASCGSSATKSNQTYLFLFRSSFCISVLILVNFCNFFHFLFLGYLFHSRWYNIQICITC